MAVATHGHASGWRASDLRGGKDDLRVALGPAHLDELDEALSTLRRSAEARTGIAPVTLENLRQSVGSVEPSEFPLSMSPGGLGARLVEVRDILANGVGIVVLDSISTVRFPRPELDMVWLGIGAHLGTTVENNDDGDFCCEVTEKPGEEGRGFASNVELGFHNDTFLDTIGMLSVARAAEGGTSYFSSILAAYDDLADHQDVEPLFTGWRKCSSSLCVFFRCLRDAAAQRSTWTRRR